MQRKCGKISALFLSALMIMSVVTACGTGTSAPDGDPSTAQPQPTGDAMAASSDAVDGGEKYDVTLTALISNTATTAGQEAVFAQMEKDLGIKMEIEKRPGGAEGENIVRARLASGDSTDIHMFNSGSLLSTLNPAKNFVDISGQPFIDRCLDSYLETVTVDGVIYGIPAVSSNAGAWLYNKAIYEELNLEIPHTWDDLMKNCQIIKDSGKTAVIGSFATDWTSQLILLADFYNVHSNDPNFAKNFNDNKDKYATNQYAFKAFDHMSEVFEKGFMNTDYNATTFDHALIMLYEGEGAHYPMLTHAVSNIDVNHGRENADKIGAFGQPGDDPNNHGLTVWMPDTWYFYKESPHVDIMMKWAEYYISEEAIDLFSQNQGANGPYVVKNAALPDDAYPAIKDLLAYFDAGKTAPALEFVTSVKGPNSPQICIQCQGGLQDATTCAEEYDKDVEKQAKQLGLEGW